MNKPRSMCAVLMALAAFACVNDGQAASMPSPAEIAAHRQEILNDMLTDKYDASWIAGLRRLCATGREPAGVAQDRADGAYFTPDAADSCVMALARTARDRHLTELYSKLITELGGSADGAEKLPDAIGASVLKEGTKVAIGNSRVITVSASLALDAGFTVGYRAGASNKAQNTDGKQLKALAEACLADHQSVSTCFSVGYAFGGRVFAAGITAAR